MQGRLPCFVLKYSAACRCSCFSERLRDHGFRETHFHWPPMYFEPFTCGYAENGFTIEPLSELPLLCSFYLPWFARWNIVLFTEIEGCRQGSGIAREEQGSCLCRPSLQLHGRGRTVSLVGLFSVLTIAGGKDLDSSN